MTQSANTIPQAARDDIVKAELLDMLQAVITAGGGLLAIHRILDEAKTMTDIRTRYSQWQTDRRAALPEQTVSAISVSRRTAMIALPGLDAMVAAKPCSPT